MKIENPISLAVMKSWPLIPIEDVQSLLEELPFIVPFSQDLAIHRISMGSLVEDSRLVTPVVDTP